MLKGKSILGVIPARGAWTRIPRQNCRPLAGHPLFAWTSFACQALGYFDRVILSTEDQALALAATKYGLDVPFIRPLGLALPDVSLDAVVAHAVGSLGTRFDYVVTLPPTAPLRLSSDIGRALESCVACDATGAIGVSQLPERYQHAFALPEPGKPRPIEDFVNAGSGQDLPPCYYVNKALYISKSTHLSTRSRLLDRSLLPIVMPADRSLHIDSDFDFIVCDQLLRARAAVTPLRRSAKGPNAR